LVAIGVLLAAIPAAALLYQASQTWQTVGPDRVESALLCPGPPPEGNDTAFQAWWTFFSEVENATGCTAWAVGASMGGGPASPETDYRLDWRIELPHDDASHLYIVLGRPGAAVDCASDLDCTGLDPVWLNALLPPAPSGTVEGDSVVFAGQAIGAAIDYYLTFQNRNYGSGDASLRNRTVLVQYEIWASMRPSLSELVGMPAGDFLVGFLGTAAAVGIPGGVLLVTARRALRREEEPAPSSEEHNHP